jgi:hypothetical protein
VRWIKALLRRQGRPTPDRGPEHSPERRRAARISAAIPVLLYGRRGDEPFHEITETIDVCEFGGLVTVSADVASSQALILTNAQTDEDLACRVARLIRTDKGQMLVGLEFLRHSPSFWGLVVD